MDYRELLKKYIRRILDIEGIDFIPYADNPESDSDLTDEEERELRILSGEVRK